HRPAGAGHHRRRRGGQPALSARTRIPLRPGLPPGRHRGSVRMRALSVPLLLLVLAGCSSRPYKVAPVSGLITLHGQPLPGAAMVFSPLPHDKEIAPGPGSGAFTGPDGRYSLTLTQAGAKVKGAVVGRHKVRITLVTPESRPGDRPKPVPKLPARYNSD